MGGFGFIFLPEWYTASFSFPKTVAVLAGWLLFGVIPLLGLSYAAYFCVTIPLRRRERARVFLDLLQTGLRDGRRPEDFLPAISKTREESVGARFHLLAAHLENGASLGDALGKVPRLLPPQVTAMLQAGITAGDVQKVLPACYMVLRDPASNTRAAFNYLLLLAFVFAPVTPLIYFALEIFVMPKFRELFHGIGLDESSPQVSFIFETGQILALGQLCLTLLLYVVAAFYIGGPRVTGWMRRLLGDLVDLFQFTLPWRRKRMQRDFAQILALLLESGVPESKAVELAGACAANSLFTAKSKSVLKDLQNGVKLEQALGRLSQSKEFEWRFQNALRSGGFVRSLSGWLEHLDAKAFQQEQAAAHLVSTAFVLSNGVLIGLIVAGIFQLLVLLLQEAILW